MMPQFRTLERETGSADATRRLGERLGASAEPGDLVCLVGDLGGGKTTFTQGIGTGLGLPAHAISSPTFTLIAEHRGGRLPLYHLDVYRLSDPSELYHLGFDDYLRQADGLIVIEWADKVAQSLPGDRLQVVFEEAPRDPGRRILKFEAGGPRSERLLREALDPEPSSQ